MSEASNDVEDQLSPQQVGGATKRARNKEKLVNAVDYLLRNKSNPEDAVGVGNICNEAGISSATFYTYYKSRNELCEEAFERLVIETMEATDPDEGREIEEAAKILSRLTQGREELLRGALIARLERTSVGPRQGLRAAPTRGEGEREFWLQCTGDADFVDRAASLLFRRQTFAPPSSVAPQRPRPDDVQKTASEMEAERRTEIAEIAAMTVGLLDAMARNDYDAANALIGRG